MKRCIIQVQYISSKGAVLSDWQNLHDITTPNSQTIIHEMIQAKKRIPNARVRAIDSDGRMLDMLAY